MPMWWIALIAAPLATSPVADEPAILTSFMALCRPGARTASDVLADATAHGWRGRGGDRTMVVAGGTLALHASDRDNHGERLRSCGIRTSVALPRIVTAVRARLGFAPGIDLGGSATFFAVGDASGWWSGVALDGVRFAAAKAAGKFYSIVASTDETGSAIYDLHPIPDATRR